MRFLAGIAFLLAFPLFSLQAGEQYPLDRAVRLDIWGGGINDVASEILRQTGVELVYYRPDFPDQKTGQKIHMVTGEVSLRLAMECLSRFFGCRYRLSESGRIEMSSGYDWVGQEFVVRFNDVDQLVQPGGAVNGTAEMLQEFLRVLPLLSGNNSFTIERKSAPDGRIQTKAITIAPALIADYFDKAVLCLKSGDTAGAPAPQPMAYAPRASTIERASWNRLLAADFDIEAGLVDPRRIMREICSRIDVAFLLSGVPGQGEVRSGLLAGRTGFGRATEELAGIFGLNRRIFLNPGAVIFEPGKPGEWEEDCKTREFYWMGLAVRGFDAKRAAERLGRAELVSRIRSTVYPHIWVDPMCSLAYSDSTGILAVMAPPNAVEAVGEEILRITRSPLP
jgi:hypothetical protein